MNADERRFGRRRFLQGIAAGSLALAGRPPALSAGLAHAAMPPAGATAGFKPDIELELNAIAGEIRVLPGNATRLWRFTGRV
ncbi:MAG TPA: hypothetical protein VFO57_08745, partial [Burkholderiales bacterium]|nr:hypothetical protein [Burkholderiales bacterium]